MSAPTGLPPQSADLKVYASQSDDEKLWSNPA